LQRSVRTARLCSAGHGGQILLSETTRALDDGPHAFPAPRTERSTSADELGDRISARVESYVERQLESASSGGSPTTRALAGLTTFGLVTLVVFVGVLIGIGFLVKTAFF
jgi:hypothetical protein